MFVHSSTPAAAVVGLEQTFFRVSEDVGVVELCAVVYTPIIECPIEFPFDVRLSTRDDTAGMSMQIVCIFLITLFTYR